MSFKKDAINTRMDVTKPGISLSVSCSGIIFDYEAKNLLVIQDSDSHRLPRHLVTEDDPVTLQSYKYLAMRAAYVECGKAEARPWMIRRLPKSDSAGIVHSRCTSRIGMRSFEVLKTYYFVGEARYGDGLDRRCYSGKIWLGHWRPVYKRILPVSGARWIPVSKASEVLGDSAEITAVEEAHAEAEKTVTRFTASGTLESELELPTAKLRVFCAAIVYSKDTNMLLSRAGDGTTGLVRKAVPPEMRNATQEWFESIAMEALEDTGVVLAESMENRDSTTYIGVGEGPDWTRDVPGCTTKVHYFAFEAIHTPSTSDVGMLKDGAFWGRTGYPHNNLADMSRLDQQATVRAIRENRWDVFDLHYLEQMGPTSRQEVCDRVRRLDWDQAVEDRE